MKKHLVLFAAAGLAGVLVVAAGCQVGDGSSSSGDSSGNGPSYTEAETLADVTTLLNGGVTEIGIDADVSLAEAVAAIGTRTETITLVLLDNVTSGGVKLTEDQNVIIDFNNHTYTLSGSMVGSSGTVNNGFQLLKGANLTLKNGTLKNGNENGAKILIQNYCDLVLDNFTVDARGSADGYGLYAVSNNFGSLTVKNGSNIYAATDNIAFDLWYGMSETYNDGVTVTIEADAGTISGNMEYGANNTAEGWEQKTVLLIKGGTFDGEIVSSVSGYDLSNANITITGGSLYNPQ